MSQPLRGRVPATGADLGAEAGAHLVDELHLALHLQVAHEPPGGAGEGWGNGNRRLSTFGKWNPCSSSAKSIREFVQSFRN